MCNMETDKLFIKFTPPPEAKFYSKNKYSPRLLSKSVPRKSRTVFRYKINRSLNFDVCHQKDYFLSPKATSNSTNDNSHLSRSAKILKALNIEYSPIKTGYKKINKTLNFDLTPSPKRFPKVNKRRCTTSDLEPSSPGINKSLNFDSCDDSPIASNHDTSVESIDENQNQTPSERRRKVKKSLSYISLSSNGSSSSFDFNLLSPTLRTDLREKIDDIVHSSITPMQRPIRRSYENLVNDNVAVSTPRNLYQDFSDDEEDRPETPENFIRLVPESMSAIKKSHRKERFSGRFLHKAQIHTVEPQKMDIEDDERPSTPITTEAETSPNYSIHSIKKSHKKDKSKRRICGGNSDDEQSDTGSLFDYSEDREQAEHEECQENDNKENIENENKENEQHPINEIKYDSDLEALPDSFSEDSEIQTPPRTQTQFLMATPGPRTPENRIDYLRKIMTDSIKKSHKKLKDSNKKTLFRSRFLDKQHDKDDEALCQELDNNEENLYKGNAATSPASSEERSSTPDNMNSSRLLLAQFSSVKKSHRKDKHRKIGFAQRHAILVDNNDDNGENDVHKSPQNFNIPAINIFDASDVSKSSFSSCDESTHYQSLKDSLLDISDDDFKLISSPHKRKSPSSAEPSKNGSFFGNRSQNMTNYESAEDEFKIYTPIKKRKSLNNVTPRILNNCSFSTPKKFDVETSNLRCETPKLGISILNVQNSNYNANGNNQFDENDESGRLTPENKDCMRIISALSSIKKSHRKDKWTKERRSRFLEEQTDSKNVSTYDQGSTDSYESYTDSISKNGTFEGLNSPKPSTSYSLESDSPLKTPPNGLGAKTYLRLVQTTSIKRSHKKMREKKKKPELFADPNLSDDGSIFDEEEKSKSLESSMSKLSDLDDSHKDFAPLDDDSEDGDKSIDLKYSKSLRCSFRDTGSNNGSIFDSDDDTDSPQKL